MVPRLKVTEEIRSLFVPYSTWRNRKSGDLYTLIGLARCGTNGEREGDRDVVYLSILYQRLCYREPYEFLQKFERVSAPIDPL